MKLKEFAHSYTYKNCSAEAECVLALRLLHIVLKSEDNMWLPLTRSL
jgi:hypothetical protein